ncbi:MAG: NADH-quinone oxidoreductase subunit J [Bdellovibrionales bacterium]|nr:NADH-quinone oxidoreductase subunit J [Bdellovibrionales bacterium]
MDFLFILFSALVLYGAVVTVIHKDMVICALHLAGSMLALAGLFFILGAHFIAGVQVLVYAGAVMVLFVMVVMLFDLKRKKVGLFSENLWLKLASVFFLTGLIAGVFPLSLHLFPPRSMETLQKTSTKELSSLLFTEYVLAFEVLGVLLLLMAVGVAVLCRPQRLLQTSPSGKEE